MMINSHKHTRSHRYFRVIATLTLIAGTLAGAGCGKPTAAADDSTAAPANEVAEVDFVSTAHTHEDPSETCFICDPTKREKGRLWCKEHGRYEDRCWLCHPELEDKDRLYCKEHALYEDECFLCHPELLEPSEGEIPAASASPTATEQADAGGGLYCAEHDLAEAECAICQPDLVAALEPGQSMKVRFASTTAAAKVGVATAQPGNHEAPPTIEALCEVQYNLNSLAKVTPLAGGVIREVRFDAGDEVAAGDVLVELHSAEAAAAKSTFLSAIVERDIRRRVFERESRLQKEGIAAEKDFLQAEAQYRSAQLAANNLRQQLVNLGFSSEEVEEIEASQDTSATLFIRAPFAGTLVERNAVTGEAVSVGTVLFTVADTSTRWLSLSLPSRHIMQLQEGQAVEATFQELPGLTVHGTVTWVENSVDPRSRMVRARVLVTEFADRLAVGLFGEALIRIGDTRTATSIPHAALQRYEGGDYVFVQNQPDLFSMRRILVGGPTGDRIAVLAGLDPSDEVVTEGSFIVRSKFLESRLGAGCTH